MLYRFVFLLNICVCYHGMLIAPPQKIAPTESTSIGDPYAHNLKVLLAVVYYEIDLLKKKNQWTDPTEEIKVVGINPYQKRPNISLEKFDAKQIESALKEISTALLNTSDTISCPLCKKSYNRKYIQPHIKAHQKNGALAYVCNHCGKGFTRKDRLRAHEKNKHTK